MPTKELSPGLPTMRVQNLRLATNGENYSLSLTCTGAMTYVICTGRQHPNQWRDMLLQLDEDTLKTLFEGGHVDTEAVSLEGVLQSIFHATPSFSKFTVHSPGWIQVLAMSGNGFGMRYLYLPSGDTDVSESCCAVPVYYSCTMRSSGESTVLQVFLRGGADHEQYQDGDLWVHLEGCLPIPVPRSCLGQEMTLPNPDKNAVSVEPHPGRRSQYRMY